jgi:hypothetical protein
MLGLAAAMLLYGSTLERQVRLHLGPVADARPWVTDRRVGALRFAELVETHRIHDELSREVEARASNAKLRALAGTLSEMHEEDARQLIAAGQAYDLSRALQTRAVEAVQARASATLQLLRSASGPRADEFLQTALRAEEERLVAELERAYVELMLTRGGAVDPALLRTLLEQRDACRRHVRLLRPKAP